MHRALFRGDDDAEEDLSRRADQIVRPRRQAVVGTILGEHRPDAENDIVLYQHLIEHTQAIEQLAALAGRCTCEPRIGGNAQRLHLVAGIDEAAFRGGEEFQRALQPRRLAAGRKLQACGDCAHAQRLGGGRIVRGGDQIGHGGKGQPQRSEES
jgi:hypothetical protein